MAVFVLAVFAVVLVTMWCSGIVQIDVSMIRAMRVLMGMDMCMSVPVRMSVRQRHRSLLLAMFPAVSCLFEHLCCCDKMARRHGQATSKDGLHMTPVAPSVRSG